MNKNGSLRNILSTKFCLVLLMAAIFALNASAQDKPKALLIDSFTYSNSEVASLKIDNFRLELNGYPQNAGLVIVYGGQKGKRGEVQAHIRGIQQTFVRKGFDLQRSPVISGGYREKLTIEFWMIPPRAETPVPSPTVDAKKVKFKGVSKKTIPYDCCF